jgi:hypothetical protein
MARRAAPGFARAAGLALIGVAIVAAAGFVLLPLVGRGLVRLLEFFMTALVATVGSISTGASIWSVVGTIAKAGAAALMTPVASAVLAALVLVAFGALYALLRLLESEKEPSP